jgi:hypothetical protein
MYSNEPFAVMENIKVDIEVVFIGEKNGESKNGTVFTLEETEQAKKTASEF